MIHDDPPNDPAANDAKQDTRDRLRLTDLVDDLERQIEKTRQQLSAIQPPDERSAAPPDVERRRQEIEELSGRLLAKYVVGYRLVSSSEFSAVMQALVEVLEGMVGLTRFEVYLRDGERDRLLLCTALPDAGSRLGQPPPWSAVLAAAERGDPVLLSAEELAGAAPGTPRCWFPIRAGRRSVGGIAFSREKYRLASFAEVVTHREKTARA
jgi:hypothetical protein